MTPPLYIEYHHIKPLPPLTTITITVLFAILYSWKYWRGIYFDELVISHELPKHDPPILLLHMYSDVIHCDAMHEYH